MDAQAGQEILSQFTSAAVVVYLLQQVKHARWFPWISIETKRANRIVGALLSIASAIGVHFAYDGSAGTLLVSGLTVAGILHGAWHALNQWCLQQVTYDAVTGGNAEAIAKAVVKIAGGGAGDPPTK